MAGALATPALVDALRPKYMETDWKSGLFPKSLVKTPGTKFMTFGPSSFVPENATEEEMEHERRHGRQFDVPGWTILKIIDAFYPYEHKPLERDAYRHVQPSHELLRKYQPGLVGELVERYIQSQIGK